MMDFRDELQTETKNSESIKFRHVDSGGGKVGKFIRKKSIKFYYTMSYQQIIGE